jgi:hypothetical protein
MRSFVVVVCVCIIGWAVADLLGVHPTMSEIIAAYLVLWFAGLADDAIGDYLDRRLR